MTENEISKHIDNLCSNKAAGFDNVHHLVKISKSFITSPLTYIINMSLQDGVIPYELKIAKVSPIYKPGDKKSQVIIGLHLFYRLSLNYLKG